MRINREAIPTIIICAIAIVIAIPIAMYITSLLEGKKYYNVTFLDLDGVYQVQENIEKNGVVYEPMQPYRDGYEFLGWYNNDEQYDFSTPITSDLFLTAKWLNLETKDIVQIDDNKEKEIKQGSGSGNSSNTGNNGNSGNTGNNGGSTTTKPTPTPAQTSKPTPTPTPTPTPVPTPKVVPPSKPATKKYTITVNGGNGSGTYDEGTQVTINAIIPSATYSGTIGKTSCSSLGDNGNYSYKEKTSYSFKRWSDGNTSSSRTITVTSNATYTAEFNKTVSKVDAHTCSCFNENNYGYPNGIVFDFINTSGEGSAANGYISGPASATAKCSKSCSIVETNPNVYLPYHISWKYTSSGAKWTVSYNTTTGVATLYGGKNVDNKRTVTLMVKYTTNEMIAPLEYTTHGYSSTGIGYGYSCTGSNMPKECYYETLEAKETSKNKIENLQIQLPKVVKSTSLKCTMN